MELIEPFLPIGEYGPYPERLRDQFEGVIWRFKTGAQWREMPGEFGPWPTVYGRFRVWRNAGVFKLEKIRIRLPVGRPRTRPGAVAADKAYSSRANRATCANAASRRLSRRRRTRPPTARKKGSRGGRPVTFEADLYRDRNTVERLIKVASRHVV